MKRIALAIILIAAVFVNQQARADEGAVQFEQANQLYRTGDYKKAADIYEQIVTNGYESPDLYFNLGNAYFKLKNIPLAILNYERARRLSPHDDDILYNLKLCNLRIIDRIDPLPTLFLVEWYRSFINLNSADGWSTVGIVAMWIAMFCAALFLITRSMALRRVTLLVSVLSFLLVLVSFVGVYQRTRIEQTEQAAIVLAQTASVKSAPDAQSTDLFVLHEGLKIDILDSVGDWKKIRLADGKVGWLAVGSIEAI
jgi:tetratricopeptide (TPR) repeat protein